MASVTERVFCYWNFGGAACSYMYLLTFIFCVHHALDAIIAMISVHFIDSFAYFQSPTLCLLFPHTLHDQSTHHQYLGLLHRDHMKLVIDSNLTAFGWGRTIVNSRFHLHLNFLVLLLGGRLLSSSEFIFIATVL